MTDAAGLSVHLAALPTVAIVVQRSSKDVTRYTALSGAGSGIYLAALLFYGNGVCFKTVYPICGCLGAV